MPAATVAPPVMPVRGTPEWRIAQEEAVRVAQEDIEVDASVRRAEEAVVRSRARLKELQSRYDREDGSTALQVKLATAATGILAAAAYAVVGIKQYGQAVAPGANARATDAVAMQAEGLASALRFAKQRSQNAATAASSSLDQAYREATGRPPRAPSATSAASGEAAAAAVAAAATALGEDDAVKERALRRLLSGAGRGGGRGGGKGPPLLGLGVLVLLGAASARGVTALPSAVLLPSPLSAVVTSGAATAAYAWAAAKPALTAALATLVAATKAVVAWGTTSMAYARAVLPHQLAS